MSKFVSSLSCCLVPIPLYSVMKKPLMLVTPAQGRVTTLPHIKNTRTKCQSYKKPIPEEQKVLMRHKSKIVMEVLSENKCQYSHEWTTKFPIPWYFRHEHRDPCTPTPSPRPYGLPNRHVASCCPHPSQQLCPSALCMEVCTQESGTTTGKTFSTRGRALRSRKSCTRKSRLSCAFGSAQIDSGRTRILYRVNHGKYT